MRLGRAAAALDGPSFTCIPIWTLRPRSGPFTRRGAPCARPVVSVPSASRTCLRSLAMAPEVSQGLYRQGVFQASAIRRQAQVFEVPRASSRILSPYSTGRFRDCCSCWKRSWCSPSFTARNHARDEDKLRLRGRIQVIVVHLIIIRICLFNYEYYEYRSTDLERTTKRGDPRMRVLAIRHCAHGALTRPLGLCGASLNGDLNRIEMQLLN